MPKIRINKTPPGFADEKIKQAWIGCEIPLATENDFEIDQPSSTKIGNKNENGYQVLRSEAIKALREKGENSAADYWESLPVGRYLVFRKDVCTLI